MPKQENDWFIRYIEGRLPQITVWLELPAHLKNPVENKEQAKCLFAPTCPGTMSFGQVDDFQYPWEIEGKRYNITVSGQYGYQCDTCKAKTHSPEAGDVMRSQVLQSVREYKQWKP